MTQKRKYEFKKDKRWKKIRITVAILLIIVLVIIGLITVISKLKTKSQEGKTLNAEINDENGNVIGYTYGYILKDSKVFKEANMSSEVVNEIYEDDTVNIESDESIIGEDGYEYLLIENMNDTNAFSGYVLLDNIEIRTINLYSNEGKTEATEKEIEEAEKELGDVITEDLAINTNKPKVTRMNYNITPIYDTTCNIQFKSQVGEQVHFTYNCTRDATFDHIEYKLPDKKYTRMKTREDAEYIDIYSGLFERTIKYRIYYLDNNDKLYGQLRYNETSITLSKRPKCNFVSKIQGQSVTTTVNCTKPMNIMVSHPKLTWPQSKYSFISDGYTESHKTTNLSSYIIYSYNSRVKGVKDKEKVNVNIKKCAIGKYDTTGTKCIAQAKAKTKLVCKKGKYDSSKKKCKVFTWNKYKLTEAQYKGIAKVCQREQGTVAGAAAEASLMANRFELYKKKNGTGTELYNYIRNNGWWGSPGRTMDNWRNVNSNIANAVKDVLVNGKRTLPQQVDEHDCIDCGSYGYDVVKIKVNGRVITNKSELKKRSNYISGKTVIYNRYGAVYTFHSFPSGDPFGYTNTAYKKAQANIKYVAASKVTYCDSGYKLVKGVCKYEKAQPVVTIKSNLD